MGALAACGYENCSERHTAKAITSCGRFDRRIDESPNLFLHVVWLGGEQGTGPTADVGEIAHHTVGASDLEDQLYLGHVDLPETRCSEILVASVRVGVSERALTGGDARGFEVGMSG